MKKFTLLATVMVMGVSTAFAQGMSPNADSSSSGSMNSPSPATQGDNSMGATNSMGGMNNGSPGVGTTSSNNDSAGNPGPNRANSDFGTQAPGYAQTDPGTHDPSTTRQADTTSDRAPLKGANSFTVGEATRRFERAGYTNVAGLAKDDQSVWRGTAMKDGQQVNVAMDYRGNITATK